MVEGADGALEAGGGTELFPIILESGELEGTISGPC